MKYNLQLIILISFLIGSCQKDELENKTLDFGSFTMDVPANWESFTKQGYDSKVGGVKNKKNVLKYDYGWFSYDFKNETAATHIRAITKIDGKTALIVEPKEKGKGILGVYIEVDSQTRLSISGRDIENTSTVKQIFASINFK